MVQAQPLQDIALQVRRSVPATAVTLRSAVVASELAAQVVELDLVPGDLVQQGQRIARLDCRDSELALASARSSLAALQARRKLADQQLARLNKLKQNRNASEEQISQRQAELSVVTAEISTQQLAIDGAKRQVGRCVIVAPFAGVITRVEGQVGNYLTPGLPVANLVDIERVELQAALLENQVAEVVSSATRFEFGGENWPLTLRTVFPVINETTQTREIRFSFVGDKPPPGAVGRLHWQNKGLTVPARLLVSRGDTLGLFIVSNAGQSRARFVVLDNARPGQPALVDLEPDTLVITDGRFAVKDQQEVILDQ